MDRAILCALNGLRSARLDAVVRFLSSYGFYAFPLFLVGVLLYRGRRAAATTRDGVLAWFLALLVVEDILKLVIGRRRPSGVRGVCAALHVLGRAPTSPSFPSGTASACCAGAAWIWMRLGPRAGVPFALLALVISVSRVYAGVHYPTDLLGGAVVGVAVAYGVERYARWAR